MKNRDKLILLFSISLILTQSITAQTGGPGAPDIDLSIPESVQDFAEPIQITNWFEFALWLVLPIAGLSALNYYVIYKAIQGAENSLSSDSRYSGNSDEDLMKRVSQLAGIMFGVGAYYILTSFLFLMFVFSTLGLIGWIYWTSGHYLLQTAPETPSIGGNDNNDGPSPGPHGGGDGTDAAMEANEENTQADEDAEDAARDEGEAENTSSTDEAERYEGEAENQIHEALAHLQEAIQDEEAGLKYTSRELKEALEKLEEAHREEVEIEEALTEFEDNLEAVTQNLAAFKELIEEEGPLDVNQLNEIVTGNYRDLPIHEKASNTGSKLESMITSFNNIVDREKLEERDEEEGLNYVHTVLVDTLNLAKALRSTKEELSKIEAESEEAEHILRALEQNEGHNKALERLEQIHGQNVEGERKLEQLESTIEKELQALEEQLQQARKVIKREESHHDKAVELIKHIENQEDFDREVLKKMSELYERRKDDILDHCAPNEAELIYNGVSYTFNNSDASDLGESIFAVMYDKILTLEEMAKLMEREEFKEKEEDEEEVREIQATLEKIEELI